MFTESFRQAVFGLLLFFGFSSLAAFIAAQWYVKFRAPQIWMKLFNDRSVGFARDLRFHRFPLWLKTPEGVLCADDFPRFNLIWLYYVICNKLGFFLFCILVFDFFVVVYQVGMIGGWKFR